MSSKQKKRALSDTNTQHRATKKIKTNEEEDDASTVTSEQRSERIYE
jgi:hypothetical protein